MRETEGERARERFMWERGDGGVQGKGREGERKRRGEEEKESERTSALHVAGEPQIQSTAVLQKP